jgi:head-tail adaptor
MSARADEFAGRLGARITILRRADDRDDLAAADGAWAITATCRAAIMADGSSDAAIGDRPGAAVRFRLTIRVGPRVVPGDRIGWTGRTLKVRAVIADPAFPDRIVLMAEELR